MLWWCTYRLLSSGPTLVCAGCTACKYCYLCLWLVLAQVHWVLTVWSQDVCKDIFGWLRTQLVGSYCCEGISCWNYLLAYHIMHHIMYHWSYHKQAFLCCGKVTVHMSYTVVVNTSTSICVLFYMGVCNTVSCRSLKDLSSSVMGSVPFLWWYGLLNVISTVLLDLHIFVSVIEIVANTVWTVFPTEYNHFYHEDIILM